MICFNLSSENKIYLQNRVKTPSYSRFNSAKADESSNVQISIQTHPIEESELKNKSLPHQNASITIHPKGQRIVLCRSKTPISALKERKLKSNFRFLVAQAIVQCRKAFNSIIERNKAKIEEKKTKKEQN